jgi:hypothetical protein
VHRVKRKAYPDAMAIGVKSRQLTSTEAKFKKRWVKKPIAVEVGELLEAWSPPVQPEVISVSAQDSLDGQRLPSADDSKVAQTEDHHRSEQLDFGEPAEVGMRSTIDAPDRWDPMRHEAGCILSPRGPR